MIEFAPNPSGPAHLGTLRTYAVAYLRARQTQQPLFIRVDAWEYYDPLYRQWPHQFLKELAVLDLCPDFWQYCTNPPLLPCVPAWAIIVENEKGRYACYPDLNSEVVFIDDRSENWSVGSPIPERTVHPGSSEANFFSQFAVWRQGLEQYEI